jgi:hypothetical protein
MENLIKKNETEIQNTMQGHYSKLEQTEDRILELEDEIEIKGKTEELLFKNSKPVKGMYKISLNLRIMGIEEGEEVQATGIPNIFNKIVTENFPNPEKTMPIQV